MCENNMRKSRPTFLMSLILALVLPVSYLLVVESGVPFQRPVTNLLFPWTEVLLRGGDLSSYCNLIAAGLLSLLVQFPVYVGYLVWASRKNRLAVALCIIIALHLLAVSCNYLLASIAQSERSVDLESLLTKQKGEVSMSLPDFYSTVKRGMSGKDLLRELGQPSKHYRAVDHYDRRSETNKPFRPVEYWEYWLTSPPMPIAVILTTNGIVERVTQDTEPNVIQL